MTALDLHNKLFTSESDEHPTIPMKRMLSLTKVQEQSSPTALTFNSPAYLDLISRQPLHPDGPRHWDLGLDLTGDPETAAECKSLEDRTTKAQLRRLQTICMVFEVVLGIWSTYCTVRYFLAFNTTSISSVRTLALVLYITSTITVVGVAVSLFMPLLPEDVFACASSMSLARMTLRGCYTVLIVATAIANLVFVLLWRPIDRCNWDMDVSWSASLHSTSSYCHNASLAAWTIAASLRVIVTLITALLYLFFLRLYFVTRHPSKCSQQIYYPPFMTSGEEADSPVSIPSTSYQLKAALRRSSSTLAPESTHSSTTLAPTLSLSNQSHLSMLAIKSHNPTSPNARRSRRIWPKWTNFAASEADPPTRHQRPHGRSDAPRTLRWKGRISSEHILRNLDSDITGAWDECTEVHTIVPGASRVDNGLSADEEGSTSVWRTSSASDLTELGDSKSVYSYGYGASEPAYPYLDVYNPSFKRGHNPASPDGATQQPRMSAVFIPGTPCTSDTEDTVEHATTVEDDNIEDELVPMMGGVVRRMATIESCGSREAATSITRSRLSRFSGFPSPGSSLRVATCAPSMTSTLSKNNSLGTVYYSVSSGMGSFDVAAVNERGELEARITSPPSYSRYDYIRG